MTQWSDAGPAILGANCTWSVFISPALMVAPSWRLSWFVNPTARPGGFDLVTVTREPPVFEIWNDSTLFCPTGTFPNCSDVGVSTRFPGSAAVAVSGTVSLPAEVSTTTWSLNCPTCVGAKVKVTVTDCPGPRLDPGDGTPVAENGVPGELTLLITSGAPPTLEMVKVPLICVPTAAPPKLTTGGAIWSAASGRRPMPVTAPE